MMRRIRTFDVLMTVSEPRASTGPAEIMEWGTDRDEYRAGDTPRAYVVIRNTGSYAIRDATARITVSRKTLLGSIMLAKDREFKASTLIPGFDLPPGRSKRFEVCPFQIPYTSLAKGTYELKADILIGNRSIGTISKTIKVK